MGLWEYLGDVLRNRKISNENSARRGVVYYKPSYVDGFVEDDIYNKNIVCSGDAIDLRSEVIVSSCIAANNAGIPVIVLHQGDTVSTNLFRKVYRNSQAFVDIGVTGRPYDPLYGLSNSQISKVIVDTAPKKYMLSSDGGAYIDVLTDFMSKTGYDVTLKWLSKCPHSQLPQIIRSSSLPAATVQSLQTGLAQGQNEANRVRDYLKELYDECDFMLPRTSSDYSNCVSIFQAVSQKVIMNLDIITDSNILLMNIIAEQMKMLIKHRVPFFVVLDNIAITEENSMKGIISTRSNGFGYAVTGEDVLSLCGGDEKLFSSIVGNSKKWFVFHHGSGVSCEKWSEEFSKYKKIDTSFNYSHGSGKNTGINGGMFRGWGWNHSKNTQQGYTYSDKDEAVVRVEEISKLPQRGGYVYTADTREIACVSSFKEYY